MPRIRELPGKRPRERLGRCSREERGGLGSCGLAHVCVSRRKSPKSIPSKAVPATSVLPAKFYNCLNREGYSGAIVLYSLLYRQSGCFMHLYWELHACVALPYKDIATPALY